MINVARVRIPLSPPRKRTPNGVLFSWRKKSVRNFPRYAERYQSRGMSVQNGFDIRTHGVEGFVKRIFAGRLVSALNGAIRFDPDDVIAGERTFVNTAGTDPDVAFIVKDRKIPAAGGGHAVTVNTVHEIDDLIFGVNMVGITMTSSFLHLI